MNNTRSLEGRLGVVKGADSKKRNCFLKPNKLWDILPEDKEKSKFLKTRFMIYEL